MFRPCPLYTIVLLLNHCIWSETNTVELVIQLSATLFQKVFEKKNQNIKSLLLGPGIWYLLSMFGQGAHLLTH